MHVVRRLHLLLDFDAFNSLFIYFSIHVLRKVPLVFAWLGSDAAHLMRLVLPFTSFDCISLCLACFIGSCAHHITAL